LIVVTTEKLESTDQPGFLANDELSGRTGAQPIALGRHRHRH